MDDDYDDTALRHADGLPPRPGEHATYAALDLVAWELEMLRED
ncbi:hypothetical protein ACFWQG_12960 [Rhodococcus sp. NPDC058532]